jgi:hypothetical protein
MKVVGHKICKEYFSEYNFTCMIEAIPGECNVATWYEYLNLWTASCDSLINTAMKIQHVKILINMPSHLVAGSALFIEYPPVYVQSTSCKGSAPTF